MSVSKSNFSYKKKNAFKIIRTTFEASVILYALYAVIRAVFFQPEYAPPPLTENTDLGSGFVALSYFGVDRGEGNQSLISTELLDQHLGALHDSGYVTVSQQDILDYYESGKPLPARSLFLMFEDGRRDTAIFAQPLLEDYNYQATALTYARNLVETDPKFLVAKDLVDLTETTYWELGSNGYQLSYINAFDRYGNFLDTMNTLRYQMMSPYLDQEYDHYLMDYIRDEHGIPKETPEQLSARISGDYDRMRDIYGEGLGYVPGAYILMHSNSPYFGTNERAGAVNAAQIPSMFQMNFNYEGNSLNTPERNLYGLSRMQPGPYWYTNHLLMRIAGATGQELRFVTGDPSRAEHWETLGGAAEFKQEDIILTTLPGGTGLLRLNEAVPESFRLTASLDGNKAGGQTVYLRANEEFGSYVSVGIVNNTLVIREKLGGEEITLAEHDLDLFDGVYRQSLEENRRDAEARKFETDARYAETPAEAQESAAAMIARSGEYAPTVEEGAEEFRPPISRRELAHRELELTLKGEELTVLLDGKPAAEGLPVSVTGSGAVLLEAAETGQTRDENNAADNVYDAVFSALAITDVNDEEIVVYDNKLHGMEYLIETAKDVWNAVVNWFINTL